jgi:hypothetical protein
MISKFILQSEVIHLAESSVRLQWLGDRHSVEPLPNLSDVIIMLKP